MSCDHCLLQWHYISGNSCEVEGYDQAGLPAGWRNAQIPECGILPPDGEGAPEQFWNCADVRILPNDGGGGGDPPAEDDEGGDAPAEEDADEIDNGGGEAEQPGETERPSDEPDDGIDDMEDGDEHEELPADGDAGDGNDGGDEDSSDGGDGGDDLCQRSEHHLVAVPGSCDAFMHCVSGRVVGEPTSCPPGTLFNERMQYCDWADNVRYVRTSHERNERQVRSKHVCMRVPE